MSALTRAKARRQPQQRSLFVEPVVPKPHAAKAKRYVAPADPLWIFSFVAPSPGEFRQIMARRAAR